jgi:predicted DNA-binding transcriptional regulator YafY
VLGGTVYRDKLIAVRDRTIERLAETWRAPLRDVRRKIVVLSHGQELLDDQQERLEMVLGAVIKQHVLEGRYERFGGSVEEFSWRPLSVLVAEGQLYVVAMDSGAPHPFRFARIRECRETTSRFDYPPPGEYDPTVTFRDSLGIYIGSRVSEIHVRLTERWKAFVLTHRWHASQTVKYVGGTHPVEIRLAVHEGPDLERWILGFGREAVVIEPRRLRDRIAACLHDAALLYTGTRRLARGPGRGTPQRSRTRDRR